MLTCLLKLKIISIPKKKKCLGNLCTALQTNTHTNITTEVCYQSWSECLLKGRVCTCLAKSRMTRRLFHVHQDNIYRTASYLSARILLRFDFLILKTGTVHQNLILWTQPSIQPHMIVFNLLAKMKDLSVHIQNAILQHWLTEWLYYFFFPYINQWSVIRYWVNTTWEWIFIMEWTSHFIGLTFSWECDILGLQKGLDRRNKHLIYFSFRMEVKVYVEGVQRIVCGVTDKTTCQEVVIALAQALGKLLSGPTSWS